MWKNNCMQALYQLKVGHVTNCLISQYPARVVLSLRFCFFGRTTPNYNSIVTRNACQQPPWVAYNYAQEKVTRVRIEEKQGHC